MPAFPSIVPFGADQTVYLVVESFGAEAAVRKTERTDIETIIAELLAGQFQAPIGIYAFNTIEHWSDDLSKEVAREVQCRCDIDGNDLPDYLEDFVSIILRSDGSQKADLRQICLHQ